MSIWWKPSNSDDEVEQFSVIWPFHVPSFYIFCLRIQLTNITHIYVECYVLDPKSIKMNWKDFIILIQQLKNGNFLQVFTPLFKLRVHINFVNLRYTQMKCLSIWVLKNEFKRLNFPNLTVQTFWCSYNLKQDLFPYTKQATIRSRTGVINITAVAHLLH